MLHSLPAILETSTPLCARPGGDVKVENLLKRLELGCLWPTFKYHLISFAQLMTIRETDLVEMGIAEHDYKVAILDEIRRLVALNDVVLEKSAELLRDDNTEFLLTTLCMRSTIRNHRGQPASIKDYKIMQVEKLHHSEQLKAYKASCERIMSENSGKANEKILWFGTADYRAVAHGGFETTRSSADSFFGAAIYFTDVSSKANLFCFGPPGTGCSRHRNSECCICERRVFLAKVALGRQAIRTQADKTPLGIPGFHSVLGVPSAGGLDCRKYAIHQSAQAYPQYLVTYRTVA